MLDPSAPLDRRVALVLRALGITETDVGEHGIEALRFRLDQPDADQLVRTIGHTTPADEIGPDDD